MASAAAASRQPGATSPAAAGERHSLGVSLAEFLAAGATPAARHGSSSITSPLRRSLQQLPHLRGPTPPMDETAMDAVLKDPVSSLLRQPPTASRSGSPSAGATTSAALSATRNDAVLLERRLNSALPAGQLFSAQTQQLCAWQQQQQQRAHLQQTVAATLEQPSPEQLPAVLSEQVVLWQQQLAHIMQQLAHQVSLHCVEHGRSVAVLQDRYTELVSALFLAVRSLSTQHAALSAALAAACSSLETGEREAAELRRQLAAEAVAVRDACADLEAAAARYQTLEQESEQTVQLLSREVVTLRQRLYDERQQHEQAQLAAAAAAEQAADAQEHRLLQAEDANAELRQRLAFVQAQLAAVREQLRQVPETFCACVQTDQPLVSATASAAGDTASPPSPVESEEEDDESEEAEEEASAEEVVVDLLPLVSQGRRRSKLWLLKVLGQLAADKAVADAVADRQGLARSSMKDFCVVWSTQRYGLANLSHSVLRDLCASIVHHAGRGSGPPPAVWFARFCGLTPALRPSKRASQARQQLAAIAAAAGVGEAAPSAAEVEELLGSDAALRVWLFAAQQLTYPSTVLALFPEARAVQPVVRGGLVMEALKAVFRFLPGGDPSGQAQFVVERLPRAAMCPPLSGSRGAAEGQPAYAAWALLDLLLGEWLVRAWAAKGQQHQAAHEANEAEVTRLDE